MKSENESVRSFVSDDDVVLDVWLDLFDFIAVSGGLHSPVGWGNACPCP